MTIATFPDRSPRELLLAARLADVQATMDGLRAEEMELQMELGLMLDGLAREDADQQQLDELDEQSW